MKTWERRQIKRSRKWYNYNIASTQLQMCKTVKNTEGISHRSNKMQILFKMSYTKWAYRLRLKVKQTQHIGWWIFWIKINLIGKFRRTNKICLPINSIFRKFNKIFARIAQGIFLKPFRCGTVLWLEFSKEVIKPELISLWVNFITCMDDSY